jgi:hypothetical protein
VKQFQYLSKVIFLALLSVIVFPTFAQKTSSSSLKTDSIRISLLTCNPHNEVYSLYGHTAIRIQNFTTNEDLVVNYGIFSFDKPYFILRFIFGLTDYEIGIQDFETFAYQYAYYGSKVTEQVLSFTSKEKNEIINAINTNLLPQNKVYRYNYFYNNCTTKARDILLGSIEREIRYAKRIDTPVTYRQIVHECTKEHPWFRFGNDLLLGYQADLNLNRTQKQFLPATLKSDFSDATLVDKQHKETKLVKETSLVVNPPIIIEDNSDIISPLQCFASLFIFTLLISIIEIKTKRIMWIYDFLLLLSSGIIGLIILAMVFSQHPTVNINFQILLLNPLSLCFIYKTIKEEKKEYLYFYWKALLLMLIIFLFLGFYQQYAEGMYFLALSLLTRCLINIVRKKKHKENE